MTVERPVQLTEHGVARGYLCWNPADVNDVVTYEAGDQHGNLFLATHHPPHVFKRDIGATVQGEAIIAEKMLDELRNVADSTGLLVMPIIGEPGTGKSRLVKWLRGRLPDANNRHIVYIGREGTTLRNVVASILKDLEGAEFDALRDELKRAAEDLDERRARTQLVFELATLIEHDLKLDVGDRATREWMTSHLSAYLSDHRIRKHLVRDGGAIDRLVRESVHGERDADKVKAFELEPDDLLPDLTEFRLSNRATAGLVEEAALLLRDDEGLRQECALVLNEHLEGAIWKLFEVDETRISDVMRLVRRQLLVARKQLFIFIEDFAILQGIRRTLLESMIAPLTDPDTHERVLCPIRVIMAVTSGYFRGLDTVASRASFANYEYTLDVRVGDSPDAMSQADTEAFVARYLNAIRLGRGHIDGATRADVDPPTDDWLDNWCEECPCREACHEAFGVSRDGFGLYPFSREALARMRRARTGDRFDPRAILGQIVVYTLFNHAEDLPAGKFPSPTYARRFRAGYKALKPEVQVLLGDQEDAERRITLLGLYGESVDRPTNLAPAIHDAFMLKPLEGDTFTAIAPPPLVDRPLTGGTPAPADKEVSITEDLARLDAWSADDSQERLGDALAAKLRGLVHAAVVARADWELHFGREQTPDSEKSWAHRNHGRFRALSVRIRRAPGENRPIGTDGVAITVEPNPGNAVVLRAMLRYELYGDWGFTGGTQAMAAVATRIERWADEVIVAFKPTREGGGSWDPAPTLLDLLLAGARITGVSGAASTSDPLALLGAALADVRPAGARDSAWDRLTDVCAGTTPKNTASRVDLRERLLEHAGGSQGRRGAIQVVDAARLLPIVREWRLRTRPEVALLRDTLDASAPEEIHRYHRALVTQLPAAVREEVANLRAWRDGLLDLLGEDAWETLQPQLRETLAALRTEGKVGLLGDAEERLRNYRGDPDAVKVDVYRTATEVDRLLRDAAPEVVPSGVVALLAGERRRRVTPLLTMLTTVSGALTQAGTQIDQQLAGVGGSETAGQARVEVHQQLGRVLSLLGEVGSGDAQ